MFSNRNVIRALSIYTTPEFTRFSTIGGTSPYAIIEVKDGSVESKWFDAYNNEWVSHEITKYNDDILVDVNGSLTVVAIAKPSLGIVTVFIRASVMQNFMIYKTTGCICKRLLVNDNGSTVLVVTEDGVCVLPVDIISSNVCPDQSELML